MKRIFLVVITVFGLPGMAFSHHDVPVAHCQEVNPELHGPYHYEVNIFRDAHSSYENYIAYVDLIDQPGRGLSNTFTGSYDRQGNLVMHSQKWRGYQQRLLMLRGQSKISWSMSTPDSGHLRLLRRFSCRWP